MSWSQRQWPAGGGPRGPRLQLPSEWDSQPQAPLMAVLCMVSPKCRPLGQPLGSLESKVATPVEKVGKGRLWRWPGGCGVVATGKGRQAAGKLEHHPPASAGGGEPAMARAPCLAWASAPWHGARPNQSVPSLRLCALTSGRGLFPLCSLPLRIGALPAFWGLKFVGLAW